MNDVPTQLKAEPNITAIEGGVMNGEKKNRKVLLPIRTLGLVALVALAAGTLLALAPAQDSQARNPLPRHTPTKARFALEFAPKKSGGGSNLVYHKGPVIPSASVVQIYWGADWNSGGADSGTSQALQQFISGFGQTSHYNVIDQYYQVVNGTTTFISSSNLGNLAVFDTRNPPMNVTDAAVQQEILQVIGSNLQTDTIYEVFLPRESYSSDGTTTSCGGPNLQYCSYHSSFNSSGLDVKYATLPYPSCGGCLTDPTWTAAQNIEHFVGHETREAVTDPDGTAWYDHHGNEADDKCTWSPAPFIDNGFAYQYEWSNADFGCVK